jgi:hypothetical protein
MMAPQVYEEARANAPIHVQLWQFRGQARTPDEGSVLAVGWVVRVFRDDDRALFLGKRIRFRVPVIHPSGPNGPELSGTIHHDWDRLGRAHWLEAFMETEDGKLELVRSQIAAIRHPTLRPVCGPDQQGFLCVGNVP